LCQEEALAHEEKAHLHTIDQRDAAEEALSKAYALVMGEYPTWSNLFGYADALEDIEGKMSELTDGAGK
jgi:hypothetical protein